MKKFFNIKGKYKFEWADFWCATTIINVILIMKFGLVASYFGLALGVLGLGFDFFGSRRINGFLTHIASIVLSLYFLSLL